jgi:hypothetical protein
MLSDRQAAEFAALSDLAFNATDPEVQRHAAEALSALRRRIQSQRTPRLGHNDGFNATTNQTAAADTATGWSASYRLLDRVTVHRSVLPKA